ncbi:MAG: hypothetical protein AAF990_03625 [Bacteroidota bacterium]
MENLKTFALLLLCCSLFLTSCKKDRDEGDEFDDPSTSPYDDGSKLEDVKIPDGFTFKTSQSVQLGLNLQDSTGQAVDSVRYTIIGVPVAGETQRLFSGFTGDKGLIDLQMDVPLHFEKIVLQTHFDGATKHFEFPVSESITDKIAVNGILSTQSQTRSNNCYPSLNSTFNNENKGFSVTSSQTMNTIEIQYTDGSKEIIQVGSTSFNF